MLSARQQKKARQAIEHMQKSTEQLQIVIGHNQSVIHALQDVLAGRKSVKALGDLLSGSKSIDSVRESWRHVGYN